MDQWFDAFTGVGFTMGERWRSRVRRHLADHLAERLKKQDSPKEAADEAAYFWKEYYSDESRSQAGNSHAIVS